MEMVNELASLARFVAVVKEMREAQKDYFKTRSSESLIKSKALERRVDELVKSGGFERVQPNLF